MAEDNAAITQQVTNFKSSMESAFELVQGNVVAMRGIDDNRNGRSTATCSPGYIAIAVACEVSGGETFVITQKGSFIDDREGQCLFRFEDDWDSQKNGRAQVAYMSEGLLR